mmetsp:Transcript_131120/g.261702  ORF Transcript_131120/g.261702 Transcript_131120/m.261702 type:complete len:208 (-) Transcript_131120:269-892(-)
MPRLQVPSASWGRPDRALLISGRAKPQALSWTQSVPNTWNGPHAMELGEVGLSQRTSQHGALRIGLPCHQAHRRRRLMRTSQDGALRIGLHCHQAHHHHRLMRSSTIEATKRGHNLLLRSVTALARTPHRHQWHLAFPLDDNPRLHQVKEVLDWAHKILGLAVRGPVCYRRDRRLHQRGAMERQAQVLAQHCLRSVGLTTSSVRCFP